MRKSPRRIAATGEWEGTKEKPLPVPYSVYVMEIYADPAACQLLRDKGVSRLPLAKGAKVKSEDKR